jgi:hypothetical protein
MTIHFFPGMGADHRIWNNYKDVFNYGKFHNWRQPKNYKITLSEYCKSIICDEKIADGDFLVGVSMGGIIAAEINNILLGTKVIQLSACTNIDQLNSLVKLISPVGEIFPFGKLAHVPNAILPNDVIKLVNTMYKDGCN